MAVKRTKRTPAAVTATEPIGIKLKGVKLGATKASNENELLKFVEDLKRQWMSTIDALIDPLMIIGDDFIVRKANLAVASLGYATVKQVVGRKCYDVFAGRKSPCSGCTLKKNAKSSGNSSFELAGVRGDRVFEVTAQPLFDASGNKDGVVHVYRDRTEAKKMQGQLAQQDKLASIGLLAGGVAHEINNPLGGILIFSQMLLREMDKDSSHYQDVVEIEAATQRCKQIVEGLLDFARINPPASPQRPLPEINILDAIRTAMRFSRAAIKKSGSIDLVENFGADEHILAADRNRIIQVFLNLIQNAIQALPDGGSVRIKASTIVDAAGRIIGIYEVEDNGIGISPEHLVSVFDPFFTTKEPGEGTGLGLSLSYGIVQEMQGTMSVASTLNEGSRFTIELPLLELRPSAPVAAHKARD